MLCGVIRPELYFWKLHAFSSQHGAHGHEFSIFVSKNFLDAVKRSGYDEKTVQDVTRGIALDAGIVVQKGMNLLRFDEFGVHQFTHPMGGGVWLSIEPPGSGDKGAVYASHNCDRADQQSLLLAMWMNWANFVECYATEES